MNRPTLTLVAAGVATVFVSCGGSKPEARVPDFVLNPPKAAGTIYGSAEAEKQTFQLAKDVADTRACREVARQLGTKVQEIVKDFQEQSGKGAQSEALEFSQVVGKTITNINLSGCTIEKREQGVGADGTVKIYSLAKLNSADALAAARAGIEANKTKVAAQEAFDELDRTLQDRLQK
jgi:hypothetical protein